MVNSGFTKVCLTFTIFITDLASPHGTLLKKNTRSLVSIIATISLFLGLASSIPAAFAYGNNTQWQIGASGTCNVAAFCADIGLPAGTTGGFWGWCAYGGSTGSAAPGTTGTQGDCQFTVYVNAPNQHATNPFHISQDITGWVIAANVPNSLCNANPPGTPCFFNTAGTMEFAGPGSPAPTGVTIPMPCTSNPADTAGNFICDTAIPAVPGHLSFHPAPGVELNIQVSKIG